MIPILISCAMLVFAVSVQRRGLAGVLFFAAGALAARGCGL